ncbi:MAG TPA: hypothetical protein VLA34_08645 [Candidatus Krumholzibacterium sp.]|nr:hypothetical protein [Candidatus Krumholzibacterium sp.]
MEYDVRRYDGIDLALDGKCIGKITSFKMDTSRETSEIYMLEEVQLPISGKTSGVLTLENVWADLGLLAELFSDSEFNEAPPREFGPSGAM